MTPILSYNVYLYIVPTEEERAVILKYRVAELIFDEESEFSEREIEEARLTLNSVIMRYDQRALDLAPQHELGSLQQEIDYWKREFNHRKDSKTDVKLEEYFDNPFVQRFAHPQDVQVYIDQLRQKTLPNIKGYIDGLAARTDCVSFSL